MLGADKTVTLYCRRYDAAQDIDGYVKRRLTGVSAYRKTRAAPGEGGIAPARELRVRVPLEADTDGCTWCEPDVFAQLADPAGHWTAAKGDILIVGDCTVDAADSSAVTALLEREDAFTVLGHSDLRRNLLPHILIEGA